MFFFFTADIYTSGGKEFFVTFLQNNDDTIEVIIYHGHVKLMNCYSAKWQCCIFFNHYTFVAAVIGEP